ncbi:uncharacterized protein LOC124925090 [Impatiens glandulifera]|uniref:uncharacterized protein LOC124925090 n=1 Tax=Impatiens glandulifera TaxID=253017 RepID=UPI001FB07B55|nr:uncharacterized protein LOC124925090 [Impatiens glandulifera]
MVDETTIDHHSSHPIKISRPPLPLLKNNSWSPDAFRDEAWRRKKKRSPISRRSRSRSVTDEDIDELKACIELGFGFDSPEVDKRLSDTLPVYQLYYDVNSSSSSSIGSPITKFSPGENPVMVKTRLKQWAQMVACLVIQSSK